MWPKGARAARSYQSAAQRRYRLFVTWAAACSVSVAACAASAARSGSRQAWRLTCRVRVDRVPFRCGEPECSGAFRPKFQPGQARAGSFGTRPLVCFPTAAKLLQGEPSSQPPAAVPDRSAVRSGVPGKGDGVSGDLAREDIAEPPPDLYSGCAQPCEELVLAACLIGGAADNLPQETACRRSGQPSTERVVGTRSGPSGPQLRQRQVGGELAPAVPDDAAVAVAMMRQPNRIAGDLARGERAVPLADQHPSGGQPVKEVAFRPCSGHPTAHMPTERYPRRLVPAAPRGLLRLGPARPLGGGAVRRRRGPQPEPFLRCPARLADP